MATVDHTIRELTDVTGGAVTKVLSTIRIQSTTIRTNEDIERRRNIPKFGEAKGIDRGLFDTTVNVEEKEVYLQKPHQARPEETTSKFSMGRGRKEKLDALQSKEKSLQAGNLEEEAKERRLIRETEEFTVKVSNIPIELASDEYELKRQFMKAGNVRRLFVPKDIGTNIAKDFAFIHYDTKDEATRAIDMFNNKKVAFQILSVEMAERSNQKRQAPRRKRK
jgi:hypothetical protein